MEIYKISADPRLEKYGQTNIGAAGYEIGYQWHQPVEAYPAAYPATVEVRALSTYRINNEYSVLYLPTVEGSYDPRADHVKGFELKIEAKPFSIRDGQCIVMPTQGESSKGLTSKCVCLGCIRKVISSTRRKTNDIIGEVLRELSTPVRYRSVTDKYKALATTSK